MRPLTGSLFTLLSLASATATAQPATEAPSLSARCGAHGVANADESDCACNEGSVRVVRGGVAYCLACPEGFDAAMDAMGPIPGGTYTMGGVEFSQADAPTRRVRVSPYCIDRTEVTMAAYRRCVEATGHPCSAAGTQVNVPALCAASERLDSQWCNANMSDREQHPVNCVDWAQADAYCRWRGASLPTEPQWEFAARPATGTLYPWGDAAPTAALMNGCGSECVALGRSLHEMWNRVFDGNDGWPTTSPVARFPEGARHWGADSRWWVYDLAGNVWEWNADSYFSRPGGINGDFPLHAPNESASRSRVLRGGSWRDDDWVWFLAGDRLRCASSRLVVDTGFRCARVLL